MVGINYELNLWVYEPKITPRKEGYSYPVWPSVQTEYCEWFLWPVTFSLSCPKCQFSMSRLNWFLPFIWHRLDWDLRIDSISFLWMLKSIKSNYLFLIPTKYLFSGVLHFTSTCKMVKEAPNYVPMNTIGASQTLHKIIEEADVPIFLVVLITPKDLRYTTSPLWDHIIRLLRVVQYNLYMTVRSVPACNTTLYV